MYKKIKNSAKSLMNVYTVKKHKKTRQDYTVFLKKVAGWYFHGVKYFSKRKSTVQKSSKKLVKKKQRKSWDSNKKK